MLSQPKSKVLQQAAKLFQQYWRHLKWNYELNAAFEKANRLLVSLNCAHNANLCSHLPEEVGLFQ
jgi:hypothetical protein